MTEDRKDLGGSSAKKVLIVDDEPTILLALSSVLGGRDTLVITAEHVEAAKEAMLQHTFDLVISDVRMSGLRGREGLELLSYIREVSSGTKVIMMTAFGSDDIRDDAYRLGASRYYEKPIDLDQLLSGVSSLGISVPMKGHG